MFLPNDLENIFQRLQNQIWCVPETLKFRVSLIHQQLSKFWGARNYFQIRSLYFAKIMSSFKFAPSLKVYFSTPLSIIG